MSISNTNKNSQQKNFVSESGDTYLVGTSENDTLVVKGEDFINNISKS